MNERPLYAPGCFGSSSYAEDDCCRACTWRVECEPLHQRRMQQLRNFLGVETKKPSRPSGSLPAKVKKIFDDLGKTEEEIRASMRAGMNPFSVRAGFVGIAAHLVLNFDTLTRPKLAALLKAARNYNTETADVYARHAIQILLHCKVVEMDGDTIRLVRFPPLPSDK
jgi:hypothetical protein